MAGLSLGSRLSLGDGSVVIPAGGIGGGFAAHTGNTSENIFVTVKIPPLRANSAIRVTTLWQQSGSGTKTFRVRYGGTNFLAVTATTNTGFQTVTMIRNQNSQTAQIGILASASGVFSLYNGTNTAGAVNSAVAQDLVISGQLATGTDTIQLQAYSVEILG